MLEGCRTGRCDDAEPEEDTMISIAVAQITVPGSDRTRRH